MRSAVLAVALFAPALAFAQFQVGSVESLTLSISPDHPRPGATINVRPLSTLIDLANSTMTMTVNGKEVYAGNTEAKPVTLLGVGQTTTIVVRVTSQGRSYSKTLSLRPGDVSLIPEPVASAPLLYAGKPGIPSEGSVRLVAVADFRTSATTRLDPSVLSYSWEVEGTKLQRESGIGKSALTIASPLLYRSQTVTVTVQSQNGSVVGQDSLSITPTTPTLRLYQSDPLQGILFEHALSQTAFLPGREGSYLAVPYSFATKNGGPSIQWFLGGVAAESGPLITLRPEGSGAGNANLSATATLGSEAASASVTLTFGQSGGLFGL